MLRRSVPLAALRSRSLVPYQANNPYRSKLIKRHLGFFDELKRQLKEEIEKDESLKKSFEEVKKQFSSPKDPKKEEPATREESRGSSEKETTEREEEKEASKSSSNTTSEKKSSEDPLKTAKEQLSSTSESIKNVFSNLSQGAAKIADQAKVQAEEQLKKAKESAEETKFVKDAKEGAEKIAEQVTQDISKQSWFQWARNYVEKVEFRKHFDEAWDGLVNNTPSKAPTGRWIKKKGASGEDIYFHTGTGVEVDEKPDDFIDVTIPEEAEKEKYTGTSSIVVQKGGKTFYERIGDQLRQAPLIEDIIKGFDQVKSSEYGKRAKKVKDTLNDAAADVRETWETSQNPWVYQASAVYDSLFGDTEMAAAIREAKKYDPKFDPHQFGMDMEAVTIPYVVGAFLSGNNNALRHLCSEGCYAQIYAAIKHRDVAGAYPDPRVLSVDDVELRASKVMEKGSPIFVYICKTQHIAIMKDKQGVVVEGNEGEVHATYYAFAMQQQLNDENNMMEWKLVEMQHLGSMPTW